MRSQMLFSKQSVWAVTALILGYVGTASIAFSQARINQGESIIPDSLLTPYRTEADTGRMAWGRQEFSRYMDPDYCDRSIVALRKELNRVPSANIYHYAADTLPTAVRTLAQQCGRNFRVADVAPSALWGEMRLALVLNEDSIAQDALNRLLSFAPTPAQRRWTALNGISTYLKGNPPRIALARAMLKQLDAEGNSALIERYSARIAFMEMWQRIDLDSAVKDATEATELLRMMSPSQRDQVGSPLAPYQVLFEAANRVGDLDAQEAIIKRIRLEMFPWRNLQDHLTRVLSNRLEVRRSLYGKQVMTLEGAHWVNGGDIPRPVAGRMSLLIWFDHMCGAQCVSFYTLIRHLKQQYGDALELILVTETRGYTIGTSAISVDEEVRRISDYYITEQKLPVTLLIDERTISKGIDGRVNYSQTALSQLYIQIAGLNAILFDAERRVQWIGEVRGVNHVLPVKQLLKRWLKPAGSGDHLNASTP
jgi:hypothetical protein